MPAIIVQRDVPETRPSKSEMLRHSNGAPTPSAASTSEVDELGQKDLFDDRDLTLGWRMAAERRFAIAA
jgi:hypothetical protein